MDAVYYFAYGSCMSPEDLARDVEEFELVGPALVRGYRLAFTRYSRARRGGVADLVPDEGGVVEGVLYRLPAEQLPALDEREGAPEHYRREHVRVETADGNVYDDVLTYVVVDKAPEEVPPHADYVQTILRGAEAYLSRPYVEQLRETLRQMAQRKIQAEREQPKGDRPQGERGRPRRDGARPQRRRRASRRRRSVIVLRRLVG
ncbi:MAG: gamma-glutamylcyclotransferase family protein [Bacillota bacterium]|nr:gamma-glutamylcyclotransferase [Bacillota bacterium]REJ34925.1 MAG: gamma-glutamylcyclotransferase [Bacillota bacterium]